MVIASKASQTATMRAPSGIVLAGQPVRVAAAVPALVARAHEARHGPQRWSREQDALADDRVPAHEAPLGLVERPGLLEDRVGDGDLADVVELGGVRDVVELLAVHPQLAADGEREVGRTAQVHVQVGLALGEAAQQHVARLATG